MKPERALALPVAFALALIGFGWLTLQGQSLLLRSFLLAAGFLGLWTVGLALTARRRGRRLELTTAVHRHHWVQALAQTTVLLYWGWHVRVVYAFLPLIVGQILFAFAVDALLAWSRRDRHILGFGPLPVVLSINLFLWFRPDWFHWQFAMIAVGYLGKELIRWSRDGRSAHIFNPSSFPLAIVSLTLLAVGASDITLGSFIANTQHDPPYIYLVIFLAALPGQILFGVASMTLSAVVALYSMSVGYFAVTGTYLFFDSHIPVPVFLGMHLLFTDPSTSPRSELGRVMFGVLYAAGTLSLFLILSGAGVPTFYDKLLPVPLMNLLVRAIDGVARSGRLRALDPATIGASWSRTRRNLAYTSVWVVAFLALSAVEGVGDRHRGQYLPFWDTACSDGSERACDYATFLTLTYCRNGSGWACNEFGVRMAREGQPAAVHFRDACTRGFEPGCRNAARSPGDARDAEVLARGDPPPSDLPILLRGTKPVLVGVSTEELFRRACEQGWTQICGRPAGRD